MRADRLLSLILLLQSRGKTTTKVLANELEVSQRTILRDVDALSLAGIPIYAEGGHGGGVALDEKYRVTLTGLKEAEIRSLFISSNTELLKEIGLADAAEAMLLKLFAALPTLHQPAVDHIRQRIHIDPLWWWHDLQPLPFLDELQRAVYEDRRIRALYEHYDGEVVERVLEPYSLVAKSSTWYLIAKREGTLRTYRASRFREVVLLNEVFHRDDTFDLATYWNEHLHDVAETFSAYSFTLRIHPDRVNFAKWLSPGRHQLVAPPGGDGWVTVHFQMESLDLARMLVFGLGKQAIVVQPAELREAVLSAAHDILERESTISAEEA